METLAVKTDLAGKTVLVTGATGFIGSHLCAALGAAGARVHGASRNQSLAGAPHAASQVDLTDPIAAKNLLLELQPRVIFHLAGLVTARQDLELVEPTFVQNLATTVNLLEAAASIPCDRIVVVSSSEALRDNRHPTSPYAAAKAAADIYCGMFHRAYGLPVVVARPFLTYGPGQAASKLVPYVITSLLRRESPNLTSGTSIHDFVFVDDVVSGLVRCGVVAELEGSSVDLGSGRGTSIRDVVGMLAELLEHPAEPVFGAMTDRLETPILADVMTSRRLLDWEAVTPLREGLLETVNWYRAHSNGR